MRELFNARKVFNCSIFASADYPKQQHTKHIQILFCSLRLCLCVCEKENKEASFIYDLIIPTKKYFRAIKSNNKALTNTLRMLLTLFRSHGCRH